MGFFTWRATKQTKGEVKALRRDQALQAQQQRAQAATAAREARDRELFQQLPPEGKAEFRAVQAVYDEKAKNWSAWKVGWGGKEVGEAKRALAKGKDEVFRKYDLIP